MAERLFFALPSVEPLLTTMTSVLIPSCLIVFLISSRQRPMPCSSFRQSRMTESSRISLLVFMIELCHVCRFYTCIWNYPFHIPIFARFSLSQSIERYPCRIYIFIGFCHHCTCSHPSIAHIRIFFSLFHVCRARYRRSVPLTKKTEI